MFHVMLVLPVLAPVLALYGLVAIVVLSAPFYIGIGLQLVLTLLTKGGKLLLLPGALGVVGAAGSFLWLGKLLPLWFFLLYWALLFFSLWLTWWIVGRGKDLLRRWKDRVGAKG